MVLIQYKVGGSLYRNDPTYVVRRADEQLYTALKSGELCYVFNARQMGKSSLLVQVKHQLETDGYRCTAVDMTQIGSQHITPLQWYKGIITDLWYGFGQGKKFDLKTWWREQKDISFLQRLKLFFEELLLEKFPQQDLCIFIDEIDSVLSLEFAIDDFFALIRYCYNQRAINPEYHRLNFALFGVATPSDLIRDKTRTPFNIGKAIDLEGFSLEEALPLAKGLVGKVEQPQTILQEILAWTSGQPFLTQKLCHLVDWAAQEGWLPDGTEPLGEKACWGENPVPSAIAQLTRRHLIQNWEAQDEPEHLRTIRDRLLLNEQRAGRLLGIYQQILQGVEVPTDDSREQIELLLSGLVVKQQGYLQVKNRIYREVFNLEWVEKQFKQLRPYSQALEAWMASGQQDESRLLRGQALKDAQIWTQGKSLSDLDYQFLAAAAECDRKEAQQALEAERLKEVEARLIVEKNSAKRQKWFIATLSLALAIALLFGITAFWQYRHATLSAIEAIATSSEALFTLEHKLDALVAAIKAKRKLQQLGETNSELEKRVQVLLEQAVYAASEFNRLSGHQAMVYKLAISPDSQTIASSSLDNAVKLWKPDGTLLATLPHSGYIWQIAFSPDSKILASASQDGTVRLWQQQGTSWHDPTLLHILKGHSSERLDIAFSPDGETLAASGVNNTVKLWNTNGTLLTTLPHPTQVQSLAFSLDGKMLVTGSTQGTLGVWQKDDQSWNTAKLIQLFPAHNGAIWDIEVNRDGTIFASASLDRTVKLWHTKTLTLAAPIEPFHILEGHESGIRAVAFSPDSQIIATASDDRTVKFWESSTPRKSFLRQTFRGHSQEVWDIAFSSDGTLIASLGLGNTVKLWQPKNRFFSILRAHGASVYGGAFSRNGQMLATAGVDGTLKLWQRDGTLYRTLKEGSNPLWKVAFSPDDRIIVASGEKTLKLWQGDGTFLRQIEAHDGIIWGVAWSSDGQAIATASADGTVKLWQPDGTLLRTLKLDGSMFWNVTFSPDGKMLATVSADGTLAIWKRDGTLLQAIDAHQAIGFGVSFSPDGQIILSASGDGTVKFWKIKGQSTPQSPEGTHPTSPLHTIQAHPQGVWDVAFSPNGALIATAGTDGTVKLWNAEGILLRTLTAHTGVVRNVAFSPDNTQLVSTSIDQTAILWNVQQILNTDPLVFGCDLLRDYLRTNAEVKEEDRHLCDGITLTQAKVQR